MHRTVTASASSFCHHGFANEHGLGGLRAWMQNLDVPSTWPETSNKLPFRLHFPPLPSRNDRSTDLTELLRERNKKIQVNHIQCLDQTALAVIVIEVIVIANRGRAFTSCQVPL